MNTADVAQLITDSVHMELDRYESITHPEETGDDSYSMEFVNAYGELFDIKVRKRND